MAADAADVDAPAPDAGPHREDPADAQALRRELDGLVAESLEPLTLGLTLVFVVVGAVNYLTEPADVRLPLAVVGLLVGAGLGVVHLLLRGDGVPPRFAHPLATGIVLWVLVNTFFPFLIQQDPLQSTDFLLITLGVSVFYLHRVWFRVTMLLLLGGFALMVVLEPTWPRWPHMGVAMLGALVIATVAHDYRLRVQEERLRSNRNLEAATRRLERTVQDLERFAHVAAHELQEPVRDLVRYAQRVQAEAQVDDATRKDLVQIVDGARRLHVRLTALLTYAELDDRAPEREPVDLDRVVHASLDDHRGTAGDRGIELEVGDLPDVRGDAGELALMVDHLVDNALRYGGEDLHRIEVEGRREDGRVVLEVRDDGAGIPAHQRDRILEPFRRLHRWEEVEGAGLGLAICARIADRHGGTLGIRKAPEGGTVVQVALPPV